MAKVIKSTHKKAYGVVKKFSDGGQVEDGTQTEPPVLSNDYIAQKATSGASSVWDAAKRLAGNVAGAAQALTTSADEAKAERLRKDAEMLKRARQTPN